VIADLHLDGEGHGSQDAFIARVGELVDVIRRRGVDAAIADAVSASQTTASSSISAEEMQP
jgi:fructuronate reductase